MLLLVPEAPRDVRCKGGVVLNLLMGEQCSGALNRHYHQELLVTDGYAVSARRITTETSSNTDANYMSSVCGNWQKV